MPRLGACVGSILAAFGVSHCCDARTLPEAPRTASLSDTRAPDEASQFSRALAGGDSEREVMAQAARQGRVALPLDGMNAVLAELTAGHGVVLGHHDRQAGLAVGYDLDQGMLRMVGGQRVAIASWLGNWALGERWAVAMMAPGELPATDAAPTYLKAAGNLQETGYAWEAVLAYDAGIYRWPGNPDALAGLGRSLRALGDQQGAQAAFAAALRQAHDPGQRRSIALEAEKVLSLSPH